MPFLFMAYTVDCNSVKTLKDKVIAITATTKEKQFRCVCTSLGIYLLIATTNTNTSCLLTTLRAQIIMKARENFRTSFQIASRRKLSWFFLPLWLSKQTKKNPQLECLYYVLSRGKWLHKHRKLHNWSTEPIRNKIDPEFKYTLHFTTFLMLNSSNKYFTMLQVSFTS